MSEQTTTEFRLNLDADEFKQQLTEVNEKLDAIHGETHTTGVATMFTAFSEGAHLAGEAIHKMGEAAEWCFEQVLDAEKLNGINFQFEQLTKNAGLSSSELKEGFEKAANGMVPLAEILNAANGAIVTLGHSAGEKLPELFEVARKQAALTGKSVLDVFNSLTLAVQTGSLQRLRRSERIVIDTAAAMDKYKESIGATGRDLSELEKQQAAMNALLEYGSDKLVKTPGDLKQVTIAWGQFKTAITELGEVFSAVVDKMIGPTMAKIITLAKGMAENLSGLVISAFGSETQKAAQNAKGLAAEIEYLNKQASHFKEIISKDTRPAAIEGAKKSLEETEKRIDSLTKKLGAYRKVAEEGGGKEVEKDAQKEKLIAKQHADALEEKRKADNAYSDELLKLDKATAASMDHTVTDHASALKAAKAREKQIHQDYVNDIKRIDELALKDADKRQALYMAADKKNTAALAASHKKLADDDKKLAKSEYDYKTSAITSFSNNYMESLKQWGSGTKDASDAMKGFFLGALGDMATSKGEFMIAEAASYYPNFAQMGASLAGGGALIALGAALGGMGGGSSGSMASDAGGGYSSSIGNYNETGGIQNAIQSQNTSDALTANAAPRSSITIAVSGNYFETEETKRRLAEIIREHQDATDFTFKQIGQA